MASNSSEDSFNTAVTALHESSNMVNPVKDIEMKENTFSKEKNPLDSDLEDHGHEKNPLHSEVEGGGHENNPLHSELEDRGKEKNPLHSEVEDHGDDKNPLDSEEGDPGDDKNPLDSEVEDRGDDENPLDSEVDHGDKNSPLDSNVEDCGNNIDTLMDRYGFFMITKSCRAVCISNAPKTVDELENAENLKATLPKWLQKKIEPKPKSDDETPKDLLITLNDIIKKRKTKKLTKKGNRPIQRHETKMKIVDPGSNEEQEPKDVIEVAATNPLDTHERELVEMGDRVDKGEVMPSKPAPTNMITKTTEVDKNLHRTKINNKNGVGKKVSSTSKGPRFVAKRGMPYLGHEERAILRYILDGNLEYAVKGDSIWVTMEEVGVCPGRTWQSMKGRFKKSIWNSLTRPEFQLTDLEISRLRTAKHGTVSKDPTDVIRIQRVKKAPTIPNIPEDNFNDLDKNWSSDSTS